MEPNDKEVFSLAEHGSREKFVLFYCEVFLDNYFYFFLSKNVSAALP